MTKKVFDPSKLEDAFITASRAAQKSLERLRDIPFKKVEPMSKVSLEDLEELKKFDYQEEFAAKVRLVDKEAEARKMKIAAAIRAEGWTIEVEDGNIAAGMNLSVDEEENDMTENKQELDIFCKKLTEIFKRNEEKGGSDATTFMLSAPASLTVKMLNGEYRKSSHIGGEDFMAISAHLGKKGIPIITFRPIMTADYAVMEMMLPDAEKSMTGFTQFLKDSNADAIINDIMSEAAAKREKVENEARFEKYDEEAGYGSW